MPSTTRARMAAIVIFVLGTFASIAGSAYAASPANDQYTIPPHVAAVTAKPSTTIAATKGGTLPFTGFSLGTTAAVGVLFIGLGLMLRRHNKSVSKQD